MNRRLLVATHNQGKLLEYRNLLADLPLALTYLEEIGVREEVAETENSFAANAALKAQHYANLTGLWTWADDSGLEVDALQGAPGVHSARYAGPAATDQDRYQKLLRELQSHPRPWTARFQCVVAIARPAADAQTRTGTLEGTITAAPRGSNGFGYDPVFFVPDKGRTLAELPTSIKNRISHRGRASGNAKVLLTNMLNA
ncbi:MAG: RdgB/HAM1 family non-canonical purine NTP pyrophosphatase [Caldilineaceae bacterium]|nr:RdgB/HAM1 family non-canonical purine NTP pyrophosphatase [Caldilineaceae bacterium]